MIALSTRLVPLDPDTAVVGFPASDPYSVFNNTDAVIAFDATNGKVWCTSTQMGVPTRGSLVGFDISNPDGYQIDSLATLDQIYTNDIVVFDGYVWVTDSPSAASWIGGGGGPPMSILNVKPSLIVSPGTVPPPYPGLIATITSGQFGYVFTKLVRAQIENLVASVSPATLSQLKDVHLVSGSQTIHLPPIGEDGESHTIVDVSGGASPDTPIFIQALITVGGPPVYTTISTIASQYGSAKFIYSTEVGVWFEV